MATAKDTKMQENGSRLFFESFIEKGKEPTIDFLEKKAYPDMPAIWYQYYQLQAKALKKYLGNSRGYNYSRDDGIMPYIEQLASSKMGVSTKDRWNPMDIIMVKKGKESAIKKDIKKIADSDLEKDAKLEKLNLMMADLLVSKDMIPISLKGLTKTQKEAKIEEANLGKGKTKSIKFKLKPNSLKCDLDMVNPPLFDTGEFSLRFFAGDDEYALQIRSFRYSIPSTGPQTDITPKSGGAKLGKASTKAIEPFLRKNGLDRVLSPVQDTMISTDGNFTKAQIKFWVDFYDKIKNYKISGQTVNWDLPLELGNKKSTFEKNLKYGLKNAGKDRNALGRITSKLHTLRQVELYYKISQKKKFEEWLSTLYYGAKKEFSNLNGPFIKIF
tara:strand:+ start:172 stop:1326 length:1155 start_codon:yes stop_codon:yes gene_type:complete